MKDDIIKNVASVSLFVLLFNVAAFGVSWTPTRQVATIWEPFYWQFNGNVGDKLIDKLDAEDSDWVALRYQDTGWNDNDVEDCTRGQANIMGYISGVTLIDTHANSTYLVLAATITRPPIASWADQEPPAGDDPGLNVPAGTGTYGGHALYRVRATTAFCSDNWSDDHDSYDSIVFLAACSASSFLSSVGGKTQFGYSGDITDSQNVNDVNAIFGRMNGSIGNGEFRRAFDAYYDYTGSAYLEMTGGSSTLAPAPIYDDPVSPEGSGAGSSGTGYIDFDTVMDTTISAEDALTWTHTGTVEVSDIEWDGSHKITFSYCGESGYSVTMTAENDHCLSPGDDQAELNGNLTGGNGDDKVWTFSY